MPAFSSILPSPESAARTLAVMAGTLLSPTWPLMHWIVKPYLDLTELAKGGVNEQTMAEMMTAAMNVDVSVSVFYLIPALIGCLALNFLFVQLCGNVADRLAQRLSGGPKPASEI